ncbi:MAG: hypothetical protein CL553_02305 [Alcanivorax sp.]|nr:hypothetical protein [Alcanivorax sp.]QVL41894.1 MAG: HEAT repeat domain-containing protein [Alcanivorax sp.]|tara:strand:+ start:443 stop:2671 length:2229 start_codon:yes stop_codon:yes gene_type:complete
MLLMVGTLLALILNHGIPPAPVARAPVTEAQRVDENECRQCHQAQFEDWQGSHHQLAMLPPTEDSVLGDFNDAAVRHGTETLHFSGDNGDFRVRANGADGTPGDFPVAYTFGWAPLQQYLLETENGRLQALGMAWDTERERWFALYPEAVNADHPLHWTQPTQNANTHCIECHTSDFQLGYDADQDRFDSQWGNLGVGCQACHGPASEHLTWARNPERPGPEADADLKGFSLSLAPGTRQLETCAQCHSRRTPLGQPAFGERLDDNYLVSQLSADLYQVDGKIDDEVFEYGSFLQSRMHQAGVVCSDCHNPHSGELRAPGNAVCAQCHNPTGQPARADLRTTTLKAGDYDSPEHHHHAPGSPGAECRGCHMPGKVFMGNDLRHDHSFSSPDPAQARALDHSDACLVCHEDQEDEALIAAFQNWYPDHQPRDGGYARALFKAREGRAGAAEALLAQLARDDLPALRRAAVVAELDHYPSPSARQQLLDAFNHPHPNVRRAAIDAAAALLPPEQLMPRLRTLLDDPVRAVRVGATEQLLMLGGHFDAGLFKEYEQLQQALLANAEAHFNLANLYQATGRDEQVAPHLRAALERSPAFSPAAIALAQWQDGQQPGTGLGQLQEQARAYPDDANLQHALGLAYIRARQLPAGVQALEQAHRLAPDNTRYTWVLAVAWHDTGQRARALRLLREQVQQHPANRPLRLGLMHYLPPGAERDRLLDTLHQLNPHDPMVRGTGNGPAPQRR